MSTKVAYIGIGAMGYPMAGYLSSRGYDVSVYDTDLSRVDAWTTEFKGHGRTSAADAAAGAEWVFSSVSTEEQVLASTTGKDGTFQSMAPRGIYVDHTTTSAVLARNLSSIARENNLVYLDAPVAGSPAEAARDGKLLIMVGGNKLAFEKVLPALNCYGSEVQHLGPTGAGQLTKMVSQIAIAGIVESLAEALHFSQYSGLDGEQVVNLLMQGPATSWWLTHRARTMLEDRHDIGGPIRNMLKDYTMCLDEAERIGARLPVVDIVYQFCNEIAAQGDSERDFTGLIKFLNDTAARS